MHGRREVWTPVTPPPAPPRPAPPRPAPPRPVPPRPAPPKKETLLEVIFSPSRVSSSVVTAEIESNINDKLPFQISNIVNLVTKKRSSKLVVLLTGMVSLIYALANPIIYGTMSMRYRWAYKRIFGAACRMCGCTQRPRSLSASSNLSKYKRSLILLIFVLFLCVRPPLVSDHPKYLTRTSSPSYPASSFPLTKACAVRDEDSRFENGSSLENICFRGVICECITSTTISVDAQQGSRKPN